MKIYILGLWTKFGCWVFGFKYLDIYSPNEDILTAITFSQNEEYINKISKIK